MKLGLGSHTTCDDMIVPSRYSPAALVNEPTTGTRWGKGLKPLSYDIFLVLTQTS